MKAPSSTFLLLLIYFMSSTTAALKTYFMPSPCTDGKLSHIFLGDIYGGTDSSGILRLISATRGDDCGVVLHPFGIDAISISVVELDNGFSYNKITFTDGHTKKNIDGTYISYPSQVAYKSKRPGSEVTIKYKCYFSSCGGFKLVFTAFKTGIDCLYNQFFHCNNGPCISKDLSCDGYDHCGDSSSDKYCSVPVAQIIGYVLGSFFLVVIIVCLVVIIIRRKRKVNSVQCTAVTHRSPVNYPPPVDQQLTSVENPTAYLSVHHLPANPVYHQPPAYTSDEQQPAYPTDYQPPGYTTGPQQPAYNTTDQQPAYTTDQQPAYTTNQQPAYTTNQQPAYTTNQQPAYTTGHQQPAYATGHQHPAYPK